MTPDGMTIVESRFGAAETGDRLVAAVTAHGMSVMARIDHAGAAAKAGLELRPTEVFLFGNPLGGTPLMQAAQTVGIDLPLKALIWQDGEGKVWLGYNRPDWIVGRHGVAGLPTTAMDAVLATVSAAAAGEP